MESTESVEKEPSERLYEMEVRLSGALSAATVRSPEDLGAHAECLCLQVESELSSAGLTPSALGEGRGELYVRKRVRLRAVVGSYPFAHLQQQSALHSLLWLVNGLSV